MKNQKFSNIYDLLDSKPKNISQLLGEFGEYVYRSYCRQQKLKCKITKYLSADVIIFHNSKEFFVDVDESFGFEYDTTFGIKSFRKDTVLDTTVQIVLFSEELGRNDTSFIQKKNLLGYKENENFIDIVKEEPMKRVEAIEYYKTYIPDSTTYFCPLTNNQYVMEISEDGTDLMVTSPIEDPIIESHYLIFSFKAVNHGFIMGGRKSWE